MSDKPYPALESDFIMALRIVYREGLSDAFAHLSMRSNDGNEMMFMPRKSGAGQERGIVFYQFRKIGPAVFLTPGDLQGPSRPKKRRFISTSAVILLSVIGQPFGHAQLQSNLL